MNFIEQITNDKTCIHTDTGYTGKIIKIAKKSSKMREILIIRYVPRTLTGKEFAASFARGPISDLVSRTGIPHFRYIFH